MPMRKIRTAADEVIIAEPAVKKHIVAVIAALGVIATGFGVAAEITRTKNSTYVMDDEQRFQCSYPGSPAAYLAAVGIVLLTATQGIATYNGGVQYLYTGPRYYLTRTLIMALTSFLAYWVCFFVAFSTLISGAIQNQVHTAETSGGFTALNCSLVSVGAFLSGAFFTFFTAGLQVAYYYVAMKARWDLWRTSGGYGGTPTAESELTSGH